jgi:hypothetical protein
MNPRLIILSIILWTSVANADCIVSDLQIGKARDGVLSELKSRGCQLKIAVPEGGLEDDLVLSSDDDRYSYHEVIFDNGKLRAVWSYSPLYTSADKAFSALLQELLVHSTPDHPGDRARDALGQRNLAASVFLQRPLTEVIGLGTVGFELENGTVTFEMKKTKDGTLGVRVAKSRDR